MFSRTLLIPFSLLMTVSGLVCAEPIEKGRELFTSYCSDCHSIEPPPLGAPPVRGIVMNYRRHYSSADSFAAAVTRFVKDEKKESPLITHAVTKFGKMPPLQFPEKDVHEIALWMWSYITAQPQAHAINRDAAFAAEGEAIAMQLLSSLKATLMQKMRDSGPANAVKYCSLEALPLTQKISKDNNVEVRRTTLRPRNSKNGPDAIDTEVLEMWAGQKDRKSIKPEIRHDKGVGVRYYRPLFIDAPCLTCHGSKIDPSTQNVLRELYPNDAATNYRDGELRGAAVVTFAAMPAPGR